LKRPAVSLAGVDRQRLARQNWKPALNDDPHTAHEKCRRVHGRSAEFPTDPGKDGFVQFSAKLLEERMVTRRP